MSNAPTLTPPGFPRAAGVLLGLGLGGFFDGIVFHQVLQWHHLLTSAGYPATNLHNLQVNTAWDGVFHSVTYVLVALGLAGLWRAAHQPHPRWPTQWLLGAILGGFGLFNIVEGLINHQVLGLHHVNETVPPAQWVYWDMGFLAWGALMVGLGWWLLHTSHPLKTARLTA